MPTTTWKGIERQVAALLEGHRVPSSGNGAIKGDVVQMRLVPSTIAEVKHGKQVIRAGPKQLAAWMAEAERDARSAAVSGAVVVLHAPRQPVVESVAVMRLGVLSRAQRRLQEATRELVVAEHLANAGGR